MWSTKCVCVREIETEYEGKSDIKWVSVWKREKDGEWKCGSERVEKKIFERDRDNVEERER